MKCSFIHLKLKDKSNINKTNNKIFELFKLSIENNKINLNILKIKKKFQIKFWKLIIIRNIFKKILEKWYMIILEIMKK